MPFAIECKHGFYCPWGRNLWIWSIRLVNRQHTVRAPKRVGKNFRKKKKEKKRRIIWILWILIDQSVPVWNLLFVIKVLILQSGSFQFPPLAAEGGSERQADLKKRLWKSKRKLQKMDHRSSVVVVGGCRERQQRLQRNIRLDDETDLAKFYKLRWKVALESSGN